jgi:hypothetical protein
VILDRGKQFYPAAAAWGVDHARTILVRTNSATHTRLTRDGGFAFNNKFGL